MSKLLPLALCVTKFPPTRLLAAFSAVVAVSCTLNSTVSSLHHSRVGLSHFICLSFFLGKSHAKFAVYLHYTLQNVEAKQANIL